MARILSAEEMAPQTIRMRIEAPRIAARRKAGQFVIVRASEHSERVPLTIVDSDAAEGSVTIIFQMVGHSTMELGEMKPGQEVADIVGPLGRPTEVERYGTVVSIGGGIGAAVALPIAVAMRQAGNRVVGIVGARTKSLLILEDEMRRTSDELLVSTDDGSYARKGFVTDVLKEVIAREKVDLVLAVGPVPMMKAVAAVTKEKGIRTVVSLNPIMVDGTGMCGGCRVTVGGKTRFVCVDGPEFDAHGVDFDELVKRQRTYKGVEGAALERYHREKACRLGNIGGKA